jgi:hypothetical protein
MESKSVRSARRQPAGLLLGRSPGLRASVAAEAVGCQCQCPSSTPPLLNARGAWAPLASSPGAPRCRGDCKPQRTWLGAGRWQVGVRRRRDRRRPSSCQWHASGRGPSVQLASVERALHQSRQPPPCRGPGAVAKVARGACRSAQHNAQAASPGGAWADSDAARERAPCPLGPGTRTLTSGRRWVAWASVPALAGSRKRAGPVCRSVPPGGGPASVATLRCQAFCCSVVMRRLHRRLMHIEIKLAL